MQPVPVTGFTQPLHLHELRLWHGITAYQLLQCSNATEWIGANECVVLCPACVIEINVNGYDTGYSTFIKMEPGAVKEWQKNNNNSDHMIVYCRSQNHTCKQSFRLYNCESLTSDVLRNSSKFRWSLCPSLLISIYGFVPPVIHSLVLAVIDRSSDARLRPILVNHIIEKIEFLNSKIDFYNTILTSLIESDETEAAARL